MFGMGFTEILFIAVIAILFLGPEKLPDAMVKIAKTIKSITKLVGDAKRSLDEEMKISELKEEALGYKKQLDEASQELQGFKNIGINPMDDINDAVESAKATLTDIDSDTETKTTQVEPKKDAVTFKKKKKKVADANQSADKSANKDSGEEV